MSSPTTPAARSEKSAQRAVADPEMRELYSFFKTIVSLVLLVMMIRGSLIEPFKIPSGSMIPTLQISDHILVSKLSYGIRLPFVAKTVLQYAQPKRGDVVVFTRPDEVRTPDEDESSDNIIKRVIGLPGDTIEVRSTKVYINGQYLPESYARWELGGVPEGNFGPVTVPAEHLLMLGDNRDHSKDSRFWEYPFLPISRVKGRAVIIYWTWDSDFFSRFGKLIK